MFRCIFHGVDICFSGGRCEIDPQTDVHVCICPSGYGQDFMTLHNPNCTFPDHFIPYYFVAFTLVWASVLHFFLRKRKTVKSKRMRDLFHLTLVYHVALEGIILGYLLQGGAFEITTFFSFLCFTVSGLVFNRINLLTLELAETSKSAIEDHRQKLAKAESVYLAFTLSSGFPSLFFSRTPYHDLFACLFSVCQVSGSVFLVVNIYHSAEDVIHLLSSLERLSTLSVESKNKLPGMMERIRKMKQSLVMNICMVGTSIALFCSIRLYVGSVPYLWVWMLSCAPLCNLVTTGVSNLFDDNESHVKMNSLRIGLRNSFGRGGGDATTDFTYASTVKAATSYMDSGHSNV